jgi:hypothetical protein
VQTLAIMLAGLSKMTVRSQLLEYNQPFHFTLKVLIFIFVLQGKWIEFDDDNPNVRKEEDILKLSGGGEHHLARTEKYPSNRFD